MYPERTNSLRASHCSEKHNTTYSYITNKSGNPLSHRKEHGVHSPFKLDRQAPFKEWEMRMRGFAALLKMAPVHPRKKKMPRKISILAYNEQGCGINYHHTIHLHTKGGNSRELPCLRNSRIILCLKDF